MQVSTQQLRAIDHGEVVLVTVSGRQCALMSSHLYEQLRRMMDDWHPDTMQRQMAEMMAEDWNDPDMSIYDE